MRILNLVLFFICGCLLTLGGYYLYFEFAKPSEKPRELAVQIMNVEEIPKSEPTKVSDNMNLTPQSQILPQEKYAKNLDANDMDAPIFGGEAELKEQIRVLRAQNKLLYDDNVDLVGKNLEISSLLNALKTELETRRKQAANANDRQNAIDELNKKLAKAQEENEKNRNLEQNLTSLRAEFESLKVELEKKQGEFDKSNAKNQNKNTNTLKRLEAQNAELKNKAQADKAKFESELKTATEEAAKLKSENDRLANELGLKDSEIKRIASEYNAQMLNAQKSTKSRIEALEKEQNANVKKISELEDSLKNANKKLQAKDKFKTANAELNATVSKLQAKLDKQKESFESQTAKTLAVHKNEADKLKNLLENERQEAERNVTELKGKIYELEDQISQKDSSLQSAEAKVAELSESLNIQKELLADEIAASKKNIQNYKILNNKITALVEGNIKAAKENKEQIDALNKLLAQKDEELSALKKQTQKDPENTNELAKAGTQKNLAKGEIAHIMAKNEELMSENENLKKIIQLNFRAEVPKKVVFIASVECADMSAGSDRPTQVCKNKVSDFLQSYNSNYYFEITPIVSRGNFIATSKAAKAIPQDELEKIDSYANFGIGKERAKVAGEMIKDEFGDFSRISYSNDIVTSEDKQGFIIKVYR